MERIGAMQKSCVFKDHLDIIELWMTCFSKSGNGNIDLFSEAALLFTFANLSEKPQKQNELSEKITEYINCNFHIPKLSMAKIAKDLGYDPKYLSAVFRAQKGVTFTEYLRNVRIKHAAFLFEEGIESVKSVAMLSGFLDALYFSKVFKKYTGLSPSDFSRKIIS